MTTIDTRLPIAPSTNAWGMYRVAEARLRGAIFSSKKSIDEIAEETEIDVAEFARYFAEGEWTICDVTLVCDCLGIDIPSLFAVEPSPTEMPLSRLLIGLRRTYGRDVSLGEIIDEFGDCEEMPARDQWIRLTFIADRLAIEAARGRGAA